MQRARGPWLTVLLLAAAGAIVVVAWSGRARVAVVPERRAVASEEDAAARAASGASSGNEAARDDALAIAAERDASPPRAPPLEPLDPIAMRALERRGRATFHGVVRRSDGAPVRDAQLFFGGLPVARSEADGAYRFEARHDVLAREERASLLAAHHPDAGSAIVVVEGPSRRIDVTLENGHRLRGRTVRASDGEPVAGAQVELWAYGDSQENGEFSFASTARSDGDGRFEFAGLPQGEVVLRASSPGRDTARVARWYLSEEQGALEVELLLQPTAPITGWFSPWPPPGAVDPRGDFEVHARYTPTSLFLGVQDRRWSVEVARDGTFSLEVPTDLPLQLELACGDAIWWIDRAKVATGSHRFEFGRIELGPLGAITGRLDAPADAIDLLGGIHGVVTFGESALGFSRPIERDGRFTVGPCPMESATLIVGSTASVVALYRDVAVEPGDVAEVGIVAPTAACWCGVVRDACGVPLALATVNLGVRDDRRRWYERSRCTADEEGRYLLGDAPMNLDGDPQLVVTARGFAPHYFDLGAITSCVITRRELVLGGGRRVRGVVRDEAGLPVVGVSVSLGDLEFFGEAHDVTGADGRFEIEGVADGEHELQFATLDRTEWMVAGVTAGGRDLELVRPPAVAEEGAHYIGPRDTVPDNLDGSDR